MCRRPGRTRARLAGALLALLAPCLLAAPIAADPGPDLDADLYPPVTAENPRVWPAASLPEGLALGAVDAWMAPERAAAARVRWSRLVFDWRELQRTGPDDWSGSWLEGRGDESRLDLELRAGRRVVGLLARTPAWAAPSGAAGDPPRNLDLPFDDPRNYWARYVSTVVARYAGRVDDWVIWNEPDVWSDETHSRQWTGTPRQYYQLLKVAYQAAKRANPGARVWMAGLTYWWDYLDRREQYFATILKLAAADPTAPANNWYFDGAVLQLYNNPRLLFDVPRVFQRLMRDQGIDPPKPVWVNETNVVPWDDPVAPLSRAHYRATMDEQASYLIQAVSYALATGTDHMAVFKWVDDNGLRKGVEQAFGMLRVDATRSPRPVYEAYRAAQEWLAPTTRAQLVDEGPVVKVYLEQPAAGRRVSVVWNVTGEPQETLVETLGGEVLVLDKLGRPLGAPPPGSDNRVVLVLRPATANTLPGFPEAFFIGGDPLLVVEPLTTDYAPLEPSAGLPRPPLQMYPDDAGSPPPDPTPEPVA